MKRLALTLIVLFTAVTLFAGGKECDMKAHKAKSVELTGTLLRTGDGDEAKTVFRVANSDQSYTVCEKTKASILKLSSDGSTLRVKGKVMNCGDSHGEELIIESAQKI
jgi:hypothetical protein